MYFFTDQVARLEGFFCLGFFFLIGTSQWKYRVTFNNLIIEINFVGWHSRIVGIRLVTCQ
jgi:hypothetical protein